MNFSNDLYFFYCSGPFSNSYPSPFKDDDGVLYGCVEQYLMAQKARMFGDEEMLRQIMASTDPATQKLLGRQVSGFDKDRWQAVVRDVMYNGVLLKFRQGPDIIDDLVSTGVLQIVEATLDPVWGIGMLITDPLCLDQSQWRGTNWMGLTLTRARDTLMGYKK